MGLFSKREAAVEENVAEASETNPLLECLLENTTITRENVMNIPAVSACVNKIADTVSMIDIKLYKKDGDNVEEVIGDNRTYLLNHETGDTLDSVQFKKAMVVDMFLDKGGYAYINKMGNKIRSIHYVDARDVSFSTNFDPIFKDYNILVNAKSYRGWQFIKLLRNTRNGYYGSSVINDTQTLLDTIYASQKYEQTLVKTGGNKKGFIQSTRKLSEQAMTWLKNAFRNLYSNNTENVVVLNEGLTFKESSNTSVELQLNQNKETNGKDICKIFSVPPSIIYGGATEDDRKAFREECIIPILKKLETAINSTMLFEDEKDEYFFECDTTDLLKGDIEKRFEAYHIALQSGFMQMDEVRKREKLPEYGLDFIKLGLQDVLYYPETNQIYTPNTNKLSAIGEENNINDMEE